MIFAEYLRKLDLQRIAKFIIVDFYEMDLMKGNIILVKVEKM